MKMNLSLLSAVSLSLSVTSCATLTTGTNQSISVVTEKGVQQATCELTDKKARIYYVSGTPEKITVHKGDGPLTVVCRKDGYKTATVQVDESFHGATLGNVLLGGGVGIVVDVMSGAAQYYPEQVIVWMEPESWSSEADQAAWLQAKAAYLEKQKKVEEEREARQLRTDE